jgi:hypothetical protein
MKFDPWLARKRLWQIFEIRWGFIAVFFSKITYCTKARSIGEPIRPLNNAAATEHRLRTYDASSYNVLMDSVGRINRS